MDEIRQKYITINKQIFNLRDGEVLQMQQEYGAKHKKSLGVPIIALENLARKHKASHDVAKLLWEFGGREQTIVSWRPICYKHIRLSFGSSLLANCYVDFL